MVIPILETNRSIKNDTPSCFIIEYVFTRDIPNNKYRIDVFPQYNGDSINIDIYRGIVDLITGNTFAPITFNSELEDGSPSFKLSPLNLTNEDNALAFVGLMGAFSDTARVSGLV